MFNEINSARADAGRAALVNDVGIAYIPRDWSVHLADIQNLQHNPNFAQEIGRHRNYRSAAENVGWGHDLASLFQAFMDSPGHRANIESAASTHVMVGCVQDGSGKFWVTHNFWGA